jgi:hypothetical protein
VQRSLTSGPRGWTAGQTPWVACPTLQPLVGWLYDKTLQGAVEGNPKLKVGHAVQDAKLHGRPATWLGRAAPLGVLPT